MLVAANSFVEKLARPTAKWRMAVVRKPDPYLAADAAAAAADAADIAAAANAAAFGVFAKLLGAVVGYNLVVEGQQQPGRHIGIVGRISWVEREHAVVPDLVEFSSWSSHQSHLCLVSPLGPRSVLRS